MLKNRLFKFLLIPVLISFILIIIWFRNGFMMLSPEEGLNFYNPSMSLKSAGVWMEYITGAVTIGELARVTLFYPLSFFHDKFQVPDFILQATTFYILLLVGVISCFFLTLVYLDKLEHKYEIALVSSVFYLLNPFTISQVWGRRLTPLYFDFALIPLSILILLIGLKKRQYIFTIFLTSVSLIFSIAFTFVTSIMIYWFVLILTFIFWLINSEQRKKDFLFGISFLLFFLIIWTISHFWWLQGYISTHNLTTERLGNSEENLNSLIGVSRSFTFDLVTRLLQRAYFSEVGYYGKIYVAIPFQLISLLLPFFVIWGIFKLTKLKAIKQYGLFISIFAVGLFVSLGASPPLGKLFIWFFKHFSFMQPFRNPYEKFGLIYTLGYTFLFSVGIVYFFKDHFSRKKVQILGLISTLILLCGIFVWPVWTGKIFAGSDEKIGVSVPTYYQDLAKFLNENSKDFRVLMTPIWKEEIATYLWDDTLYLGTDPSLYLVNRPAISSNYHIPYFYDFVSNIRRYMDSIDLSSSLSLLRVKYLVDREDAINLPDYEKLHYKSLTSEIHPPDVSTNKRLICQSQDTIFQNITPSKLTCQISASEQNWQNVRYLHLKIKISSPSILELAILDKNGARNSWEGRVVSDYQTQSLDWTDVLIPVNVPTTYNYYTPINLSQISTFEILAYPKDSQNTDRILIEIKDVKLDEGTKVITDSFRLIETFGKLKVYEPNYFKSSPEFGTLSQVYKVDSFVEFFGIVNQKKDSIDQSGFLLTSQNPKKDLSIFSKAGDLTITDKSKLSETRYWVETDKNSERGYLILSKTFNPLWKIIPDIKKSELDGSFINDLKLLKRSFLDESEHFVINGYANLWNVDGNKRYAIIFAPQILENIGSKVSVVGIMIIIGITSIWGLIKLSRIYRKN